MQAKKRKGVHLRVSHIENQKALPSMQAFFYICEYLGITPKDFFEEENTDPEALQEFLSEAKKLEATDLYHILGLMKSLNQKK